MQIGDKEVRQGQTIKDIRVIHRSVLYMSFTTAVYFYQNLSRSSTWGRQDLINSSFQNAKDDGHILKGYSGFCSLRLTTPSTFFKALSSAHSRVHSKQIAQLDGTFQPFKRVILFKRRLERFLLYKKIMRIRREFNTRIIANKSQKILKIHCILRIFCIRDG
jgi:hypothetical protein